MSDFGHISQFIDECNAHPKDVSLILNRNDRKILEILVKLDNMMLRYSSTVAILSINDKVVYTHILFNQVYDRFLYTNLVELIETVTHSTFDAFIKGYLPQTD